MATESKRGCGFRKVGGLYLVGDYIPIACDRLPYPLDVCPVCGAGIKVGRGMTAINPLHLFGRHSDCTDKHHPCFICDPTEDIAYIMRVGEKYYPTPEDFIREGIAQGFSKRIAQIPHEFVLGETIIYLAHIKACVVNVPVAVQQAEAMLEGDNKQPRLLEAAKIQHKTGLFGAFIPQRIEKLYWQNELDNMSKDDLAKLQKRGITPVGIPNGDKDHL